MLQVKVTTLTDKRLRLIYDVISGIRVLKMNAWEWCFRDLVSGVRRYVFSSGKWDKWCSGTRVSFYHFMYASWILRLRVRNC